MNANFKKFKDVLNREELRQIKGGIVAPKDCVSTCTGDASCTAQQANSYCSYLMCSPDGGGSVKRYSCQYIND